jgi:subtilisin
MKISKKLCFCLLLVGVFAFVPLARASADGGRYFVKSTKGFWKNTLGVRHNFENGFSADLSDFQVRFAKLFGVEVEPVAILQILPDDSLTLNKDSAELTGTPLPTSSPKNLDGQATLTPDSTKIPTPKVVKGQKGVRYVPSDQTPWGIETIYDNPSLTFASGGFGINVAVLDTGVDISHPDLKRRVAQCKDFTNLRFPVVDNKCDDKNGHGTHVTGIIAADAGADRLGIYGIAPAAKILAYKVCGANGSCYADDIAMGLRAAADVGANVVNMSFGTDKDVSLIRDAIGYASSKGVLLVAAAGNDGPFPDSIDYPAAYASVVAVGAVNKSLKVTDWSSRGINSLTEPGAMNDRDIEFAAPGEYIESTWNNGGYVILSGTSMASPFVAGLAAKYWQSSPVLEKVTPAQATRDLLRSLVLDLLPPGEDNDSGFGLPQVPE